jgi:hypothetical protein
MTLVVVLDHRQAADAGADRHADAAGILLGAGEPRIRDGLGTRGHAVLDEQVHLAGFLGIQVGTDVEVLDGTPEARVEAADIEVLDGGNAALAGHDVRPALVHGISHRRDQAEPGHHNPSTSHQLSSRHPQ